MDYLIVFEREGYACSLGSEQLLPTTSCMPLKKLKCRQKLAKRKEVGDMSISVMAIDVSSVEEYIKRPLAKFKTFSENDFGYNGSTKDLIVNWVHLLFLNAKTAACRKDN